MSSNDYIRIVKEAEDRYEISHRDDDTNDLIAEIGVAKDPEEAIKAANKYQEEDWQYPIEYGIKFIFPVNQEKLENIK